MHPVRCLEPLERFGRIPPLRVDFGMLERTWVPGWRPDSRKFGFGIGVSLEFVIRYRQAHPDKPAKHLLKLALAMSFTR
jgi:hypothetical protein